MERENNPLHETMEISNEFRDFVLFLLFLIQSLDFHSFSIEKYNV